MSYRHYSSIDGKGIGTIEECILTIYNEGTKEKKHEEVEEKVYWKLKCNWFCPSLLTFNKS
jgi:hypothetical protein